MKRRPLILRALLLSVLVLFAPAFLLAGRAQRAHSHSRAAILKRARAFEDRVRKAVQHSRKAVVTLRVFAKPLGKGQLLKGQPARNGGSGVLVDREGFVLTNDHVVEGGQKVQVMFANGLTLVGVVWARDPRADLALVKIETQNRRVSVAQLGDSQALKVGQAILAMGNALGLSKENGEPCVSLGVVSALHRYQGGRRIYGDAIQFDAPVNPGNSGGGLFDLSGRLVGITGRISVRGRVSKNVGVGYAVPSHQIKRVLKIMKSGKDVQHGYLGLRFRRAMSGQGVPVAVVLPGSPAEQAGIRVGDVITAIDGVALTRPLRLQNMLSLKLAGESVKIDLKRALEQKTVTVTLARSGS